MNKDNQPQQAMASNDAVTDEQERLARELERISGASVHRMMHTDRVILLEAARALLAKAQQPSETATWNAAVEAAAKKCDELADCAENTGDYRNGAIWCAARVRSLLRPAAQEDAQEQPADEQAERIAAIESDWNSLMDALNCEDTDSALNKISALYEIIERQKGQLSTARREAFEQACAAIRERAVSDEIFVENAIEAIRALQLEATSPAQVQNCDFYTPIFNAIGEAVEWRENKTFEISVKKFKASLASKGFAVVAAPAQSEQDRRDAERYRFACENGVLLLLNEKGSGYTMACIGKTECDTKVDAAMQAQRKDGA